MKKATIKQKKLIASLINQISDEPLEDEEYDNMTMADASKLIYIKNSVLLEMKKRGE